MYSGTINFGWTCPQCGRVYSPSVMRCLYCNDTRVVWATTAKPKWIYESDDITTGSIYNDEWWKRPSVEWEDIVRKVGLPEDD